MIREGEHSTTLQIEKYLAILILRTYMTKICNFNKVDVFVNIFEGKNDDWFEKNKDWCNE
jgi:hypothetical protein